MRVWFVFLTCFVLASCAEPDFVPVFQDAKGIGETEDILVATNRLGSDGRTLDVSYERAEVSVPPNRAEGTVPVKARQPNPRNHFVLTDFMQLDGEQGFRTALKNKVAKLPADGTVTLFVHGFNSSHSESIFRLAQMNHDFETSTVPVLFSWPSAGRVLGYSHDQDSMIFSRDALEQTLMLMVKAAPGRILITAHSMGGMLVMETLRQIEIKHPGWSAKHLQGLVLISPDIDIDVFESQLQRIKTLPQPFVLFVSRRDLALRLSGLINGDKDRLGSAEDLTVLGRYPILVIDITEFGDSRGAGHFTVASTPALTEFFSDPELREMIVSGDLETSGGAVRGSIQRIENAISWILFPRPQRG